MIIRTLTILLLSCVSLRAASPIWYAPVTNDLVAIEIKSVNNRNVAFLSGNSTTNSYFRIFLYKTNSTATLDGKTVFKPTNQNGRWEEVNVFDVASGFRIAGAATSGTYLRGNGTSFVGASIAAADVNLLATVGANAIVNTDAVGALQGLPNARGTLIQGGAVNWTTTAIGTSGKVWTSDGTDGSWQTPAGGSGTVTSVALALPASIFDISGSPVTTSGTLTATFDTQTANTVFAGPTSGGATTPAFRALIASDITSIPGSFNITRTAANYTALITDHTIIGNSGGGGDITITLPVTAGFDGHIFIIIRSGGAGNVIIDQSGGGTLDTLNTSYPVRAYMWLHSETRYQLLYSQVGS